MKGKKMLPHGDAMYMCHLVAEISVITDANIAQEPKCIISPIVGAVQSGTVTASVAPINRISYEFYCAYLSYKVVESIDEGNCIHKEAHNRERV